MRADLLDRHPRQADAEPHPDADPLAREARVPGIWPAVLPRLRASDSDPGMRTPVARAGIDSSRLYPWRQGHEDRTTE